MIWSAASRITLAPSSTIFLDKTEPFWVTTVIGNLGSSTLIISGYYNYLVGFSNYTTELIVFNSIYLLTSILYNLIYFSIFYLNRLNELKLHHENQVRKSLESELKTYKNKINPEFLFSSFETIICLV